MAEWRQSENTNVKNGGFGDASNYAWWRGQDGNIWANIGGVGVRNLGKGDDLNGKGVLVNGINMDPKGILLAEREIADPVNGGTTTTTPTGYSTSNTYNAQLAAEKARQAKRASEAQGIKDSMLGRRGEFESVLNDILKNIDTTYKEESNRRKETYDSDAAELMQTLEKALPEIAASFAAIGGYDSSLRGYREMDAEKEHQSSQDELKREYEADLGNLGAKANQARTDARTSYNNFMTDFDTLANTEANSDNLETIRKSENSLNKGLNDFRGQSEIYKPNSTFSNEMKNLGGDYDFGSIKDAFTSFLNTTTAGNGGSTFSADEKIAEEAKKQTGKTKSEIEQNKSTGVSK